MAFPLIPFAAGLAVGSVVTYGYKDEKIHDRVVALGKDVNQRLADAASAVGGMLPDLSGAKLRIPDLSKLGRTAERKAGEAVDAVEDAVAKVTK